jgi:hypothetical protein
LFVWNNSCVIHHVAFYPSVSRPRANQGEEASFTI